MTIFNLILVLTMLGHLKSSDSLVNPEPTPSIDSLRIIEKVYIHTDRNCYYPGDDIWFKAYFIDASDRLLSNHSYNLHVELISPSSQIILSHIVRLAGGLGNGDLKLRDNLKSGTYRIRAYTNYMRNFSDHLFFNKEIAVVNSADTINDISAGIKYADDRIDLRFFPEGGSLVENVPSVVAFKATDPLGKGCDLSGEIFSSAGELITTFKSDHLGMGSFILRPLPRLSYYSDSKDSAGTLIRTEIPKSFPSGITLSASFDENNELVITTRTNAGTLPLLLDKNLLLTFSARRVPLKTVSFKIISCNNSFTLPVDDLPDGIIMMTLSAPDDLPLSERLIFIQRETNFKFTVESDKQVYNKRDSVAIKLTFSSGDTLHKESFLSLSAVEKGFTDNTYGYPSTISSYFLLESDIRGTIEEPSYYFDPSNPNRLHDLDLLLLTQGWRDFEWKYNNAFYPPESGFTVSGRVRKLNADKPIEDPKINIGIFDNKESFVTNIPVDSSGQFSLDSIDLTGNATLIVSSINKKGNPQGFVLLDSMKYTPEKISDNPVRFTVLPQEKITTYKLEHEVNESVRKKYKLSDTINIGEVNIIARKKVDFQTKKIENERILYGKPDAEVKITQTYSGYSNVFEVLIGKVAGVRVTKSNNNYEVTIRGSSSINLKSEPLYLIDGIQKTYEDLLAFPVGFVDRIDILKSAGEIGVYGVRGANGVISIITRTGDIILPDKPVNHTVNTKFSGYNEARIFYSPQHSISSATASVPDFRPTLFWKPDIILQPNKFQFLKYFNADNSSTIRVTVEGITTTGIPITGMTEYEVR